MIDGSPLVASVPHIILGPSTVVQSLIIHPIFKLLELSISCIGLDPPE